MVKNRVQSLDYLRGLMAFGIMVYHFFLWTGSTLNAETFLGKTGIYGVSVFYVLSGLTLFIVYDKKLTAGNAGFYFIKRVFRIFPLLWLSIFLTLIVLGHKAGFSLLALNLTGLFGFVAPDKYIAVASWSIGNELVFYVLFPLVILLKSKTPYAIRIFFVAAALSGIYFAFIILSDHQLLRLQWKSYINPLNQVVLFSGGVLIGQLFSGKKIAAYYGPVLLMISVLVYIFYPVKGDQTALVTGFTRLVYVLLSFTITASFLLTDFRIGKVGTFVFSRLGEASYSVYLLHPVVFHLLRTYVRIADHVLFMMTGIITTLILSTIVYRFVETPFIKLGQGLINWVKERRKPAMLKG